MRLIVILLSLIWVGSYWSQCDNKVSTNPYDATNEALPDVYSSGPPYAQDGRYLNGFDWWSPTNYPLSNMMYNPNQPYNAMSNIQSANAVSVYNYLNKFLGAEEMTPQNGWELLLVNLGRYPDNITIHSETDLQAIPYVVLYNKYTGIMRVFVQYGYNEPPNDAIDGVLLNLVYFTEADENNVSGILRLGEGVDQPLDIPTDVQVLSAIAPPSGAYNFWMSGDFQVTYDPCVCSYPTDLKLEFRFFSTTDLELYGRGIAIEEDIVDANGSINNADFLSGISFDDADAEGGYIMYKKMETLVDDYIAKKEAYLVELAAVNAHNKQVERELAIVKAIKDLVMNGVSAGLTTVTGMPWFLKLQKEAGELIGEDSIDLKKLVKEGEKILGKELNTYINSTWSKKTAPQAPAMPTATFSEMRFSGRLTNTTDVGSPLFSTPGSFQNQSTNSYNEVVNPPYGYPVYNQPLGVFALLETPVIEVKKGTKMKVNQTIDTVPSPFPSLVYTYEKNVKNGWQYRLKDPLKFAFNNILGIENYTVYCAIELEYKDWSTSSNYHKQSYGTLEGTSDYSSSCHVEDDSYNVNSEHINVNDNDLVYKSGGRSYDKIVYTTPYVEIEGMNSIVAEVYNVVKNKYSTIAPENYPSFYTNGEYYLYSDPEFNWDDVEVRLKLKVDVDYESYHDNGDKHAYTYNFTYKIDEQDIVYGGVFDEDNTIRIGQFENLSFFNEYFDGSPVYGCELDGNTYTCKCWNNIQINGDVTVANGYNVKMWAGNEINVVNNSNISSEVILEIVPRITYVDKIEQQTEGYVYNFCQGLSPNSPSYKANTTKSKDWTENQLEIEESEDIDFLNASLSPNPASNTVFLGIKTNIESDLNVELFSVAGKLMSKRTVSKESVLDGEEIVVFNVGKFSSGIYVLIVSSDTQRQIKKLVIR